MRVRRLTISNFRGVSHGTINFAPHTLLVGGNNVGKSTICEALDLVLGPERLYRRPVIDEHDFYNGRYLTDEGNPVEIRIEALLVDLSAEAELRFHRHLRRWNENEGSFADETEAGPEAGDEESTCWSLPVLFVGRYNSEEDDFVGNTFLAHPIEVVEEEEEPEKKLAPGLKPFIREHKRICGFVFLRAVRTGSRALSLQRGSLLDTILRLGGNGFEKMWQDTLKRLRELDPPIGEIDQLKTIQSEIRERMARFINLARDSNATAFFPSELTREHVREVVRLFVATEQSDYLVPFPRLGMGTINMLVFALLTFIAELKNKRTVVFAMEEAEIALPPHTQRRVARFVLNEMGQVIITSHSPYIIEQFDPEHIVTLDRKKGGILSGRPIDLQGIKPKAFKVERRQFAEAVLSNAVLVVEGSTETALFPVASTVLEKSVGADRYSHFDLAGVSVFNAGSDGSVPRYGPIFKAIGKRTFAFFDKLKTPLTIASQAQLDQYTQTWESAYSAIEDLLVEEMQIAPMRRFLDDVQNRSDYPKEMGKPSTEMTDDQVKDFTKGILVKRKGDAHGYAALLIGHCESADELPATIRSVLETINQALYGAAEAVNSK